MRPPISEEDFAVIIEPYGDGGYRARVPPSAGGSAPTVFEPPVEVARSPKLLRSLEGLLHDACQRRGAVARDRKAGLRLAQDEQSPQEGVYMQERIPPCTKS